MTCVLVGRAVAVDSTVVDDMDEVMVEGVCVEQTTEDRFYLCSHESPLARLAAIHPQEPSKTINLLLLQS